MKTFNPLSCICCSSKSFILSKLYSLCSDGVISSFSIVSHNPSDFHSLFHSLPHTHILVVPRVTVNPSYLQDYFLNLTTHWNYDFTDTNDFLIKLEANYENSETYINN